MRKDYVLIEYYDYLFMSAAASVDAGFRPNVRRRRGSMITKRNLARYQSWSPAVPRRRDRRPRKPIQIAPFVSSCRPLRAGRGMLAARLVGDHLSRAFGQQIVVENRSGANANIGIEAVARSAPDGYTALVVSDRVASAAHFFKASINPIKDLVPVIQVSRQPVVLAVHPSLGVVSLAEFLTLARQRPGLAMPRRAWATSSTSWPSGSRRSRASSWSWCRTVAAGRRSTT